MEKKTHIHFTHLAPSHLWRPGWMVPSRFYHITRTAWRTKLSMRESSHHSIVLCGCTHRHQHKALLQFYEYLSHKNCFFLFLRHCIIICFHKTTMKCSYDQDSSIKASNILILEQNTIKITGRDKGKNDKIDHICEMVLFIFSLLGLLLCKQFCCFIGVF